MVQNNSRARRGRPSAYDLDEVVARATAVFWAAGYDAVSVDDLERATGLNRSSLYSSLEGKRGLFDRCLRAYVETSEREQYAPVARGDRGVDDLLALVDGVERRLASSEHPPGCFAVRSLVRGDGADIATASRDALASAIRAALARAQSVDGLDPSLTTARAALVEGSLLGMLALGRAPGIDLAALADGLRTQIVAWRDRSAGASIG